MLSPTLGFRTKLLNIYLIAPLNVLKTCFFSKRKDDSKAVSCQSQWPEDIFPVLWTLNEGSSILSCPDSHCGGGSCRSGVTPCVSPLLPTDTLLSCSITWQTYIVLLDCTTNHNNSRCRISGHIAGEGIVGAAQSLTQTKPSFSLHYIAVLILLVQRQHCWSYLTKTKAFGHL